MATPSNVTTPVLVTNHTAVAAWAPPALELWQFDNCALYADYASMLIRNSIDAANLSYQSYDLCAIRDWNATAEYLASALPQDVDRPTQDIIVDWYEAHCITLNFEDNGANVENNLSKEIIGKMFTWTNPDNCTFSYQPTPLQCTKELRNRLNIEANSDIMGIGVLVSYFIEAGLASAFAAVMALERFHSSPHPSIPGSRMRYRSVQDSFAASLSVFFWASVLLCLGMQLASLMTIVEEYKEKDIAPRIKDWVRGETYYINTSYFATLASGFSLISVLLAGQLLLQGNRRRRRLVIAILVVVGILQTTMLVYYLVEDNKDFEMFLSFQNPIISQLFMHSTMGSIILTLFFFTYPSVVGLVTLVVAAIYRAKNNQREWKLPRRFKTSVKIVLQAILMFMMWALLSVMTSHRAEFEEINGKENPLNEWTFGQILALSTWVPVVVEFVYTFFCEPPFSHAGLPRDARMTLTQHEPRWTPGRTVREHAPKIRGCTHGPGRESATRGHRDEYPRTEFEQCRAGGDFDPLREHYTYRRDELIARISDENGEAGRGADETGERGVIESHPDVMKMEGNL
ncbi:hypothetical protein PG996_008786 [Apiospora saccharicola]|uniref:Uncharacterized protein n=1 Tax=Apiospora saccharicola TaxID=335842 RepID=A0ABR1UYW9_9PEZI